MRSLTLVAAATLSGCVTTTKERGAGDLFFIGSNGTQLSAAWLDAKSGALRPAGTVTEMGKPTWSVRHPGLPILYVADQVGGEGKGDGHVFAYRIDPVSGALAKIGEVSAGGAGTTHLWYDAKSRTLFASNFGGGSVSSIAINADGSLGALVSTIKASGSGPHRRQQSPHAHGSALDPSGRYLLVADLGADRLFIYPFDPATRMLRGETSGGSHFALPPGTGPRHFVFHPNGRFVYLLGELTAEIYTLRWDAAAGRLNQLQVQPLHLPGHGGNRSAAEIAISRDGRFVYTSNRGDSTIVVHAVDQRRGTLREIQRVPSGGENPWHFAIHPGGRWMVVANERSNSVNSIAIDPDTGRLSEAGGTLPMSAPVNITFARVR